MTVREIVEEYLKAHGYSGLVNQEVPCGCGCDDLFPCDDESHLECEAGYVHHCDSCPLAEMEDGQLVSKGCDVEDHPSEGDYCVGIHKEVHQREPAPLPAPWITDAKLQDVVEFYYGDKMNEQKMTGVVKMISPNHYLLGLAVEGHVKLVEANTENFIRIIKPEAQP